MATVMKVGLIECVGSATKYQLENETVSSNYQIKKVFTKENHYASEHYPDAEFVDHKDAILNDGSIDLVIVASPDDEGLEIVSEALGAGKNVRIL